MTFEDVEIEEPDPTPGGPPPRRRRVVVTALLVGVPVLTVAAVLGARALSGADVDIEPVSLRVSAFAQESMADGSWMTSGVGFPGRGTAGSASAPPESGVTDVTVFCSSVQARPADLVVRSGGEVVGETTAVCSDAADRDADPAVTVLPDVPITGSWSFDLVPETTAATAVVLG